MGLWIGGWLDEPASTSPPIISLILLKPVRTTEQYCAWLSTTCSSRDSMYSRKVGSQVLGITERVSNL